MSLLCKLGWHRYHLIIEGKEYSQRFFRCFLCGKRTEMRQGLRGSYFGHLDFRK